MQYGSAFAISQVGELEAFAFFALFSLSRSSNEMRKDMLKKCLKGLDVLNR
jgi:hypothetical protein